MEKITKKIYNKDFFFIKKKGHWIIFPTIVYSYKKDTFLETGVVTPSWGLTFRWFIYMVGIQIQEDYKIINDDKSI